MAITNASDLLVYAKTTSAVKQVTRIFVKKIDPIELPDGATQGTLKINNITSDSGLVSDGIETVAATNYGTSVMSRIAAVLTSATHGYTDLSSGNNQDADDFIFRDFENGADGLVPTLEIVNGTATINQGAIIIEILTPGSSEVFDPVSFSTNASFSSTVETRDITHKDSGGFTEVMSSTKSFEISSESLQTINPDTPLDGTDFFHELKERDKVKLAFSDRIRNIIRTNLTQSGVDGFGSSSGTQLNLQDDPFGGKTASKFTTPANPNNSANLNFKFLKYTVDSPRLEGKNVNWSFYIKGSGSTSSASITVSNVATAQSAIVTKLEGDGSIAQSSVGSQYWNITSLNTGDDDVAANWTRVSFQMNNLSTAGGTESNPETFRFVVYPGVVNSQDSDAVLLSSWQIELSDQATDYQDPTTIKSFQGEALVTSVSYDAGVEDNLTCSATFTGTGDIFIDGLGPELIGDTGFDLPNDGNNPSSSYWEIGGSGASVIEDGYFKLITVGSTANTFLRKRNILTEGDFYLLTYTVATTPSGTGGMVLEHTSESGSTNLPLSNTPGTHKLQFRAGQADFTIKRNENPSTRWLSSISLKKVF